MLNQRGIAGVGFSNLDTLSLIVAALGHDVGHDGFTNAFHRNAKTDRWANYSDVPVQEGYHAATTILLLEQENLNFLSERLTSTAKRLIKKRILVSILDTDMGGKKDLEMQFQRHLEGCGIRNGAHFGNFIDKTTSDSQEKSK